MKHSFLYMALSASLFLAACKENSQKQDASSASAPQSVGQSGVKDDISRPNIVQTTVSAPDLSTLVKAVQAAGLVDALSNAGPFTVFAPTNAAFDKLPKGTLETLLKPENKDNLVDILGYHTYVGVLRPDLLQDGQEFDMVASGKVKITRQGDKIFANGTELSAPVETSNGIVYIINDVLLPPEK